MQSLVHLGISQTETIVDRGSTSPHYMDNNPDFLQLKFKIQFMLSEKSKSSMYLPLFTFGFQRKG